MTKFSNKLLHYNDEFGVYPASWYAASANPAPALTALTGVAEAEISVIGGGYTGLSTALHLAERGHDVVLLEAHRMGWGASGRNGGQVGSGQRKPVEELETLLGPSQARAAFKIGIEAPRLVRDLISKHNIDCAYKPGVIHANHRRRFDEWSQRHTDRLRKDYGYDAMEYLSPSALAERLGTSAYSGGTIDHNAGHLHPLNYAFGLVQAARLAGARLFERSEVLRIEAGDRITLHTRQASVHTRQLVIACNGYLGALDPQVAAHVMPINNYIIATEPLGETRAQSLIRDDAAVADSRFIVNYYRLSHDKRLLFGGGENYGYRFPADIKSFVRPHMLKIYPQLADVKIDYGWGGTLAITMNRLPYFKRLAPNVINASGYSGSGVALATMSGKLIAEAIKGQSDGFDVMANIPASRFPGGSAWRHPILAAAMLWYGLRDRF